MKRKHPDSGSITLTEAIVWFLLLLGVIIGILAATRSAFTSNDVNNELNNVEFMVNKSRTLLKQNGIYDFSDEGEMTGALIEYGGVPDTMNVTGDKSTGNATLQNVWGGAVSVAPVADDSGNNTGFSITYNDVTQSACATLAGQLSSTGLVDSTSVNGTSTDGAVSVTDAGSQCTADDGSKGSNVLIFTSNT
ncbi:type 4 pilus major pilin [Scandinavium goeteborgense]|uniref:type 4 pilus major pilin n=1 Tax=Scandinavium goeteborgense TaxID=1851514 RepID=UPI0038278C5F